MTPEKALELVGRYAKLKKVIKDATKKIGENLELCPGLDGKRLEVDRFGCFVHQRDTDSKYRDKSTHLWHWYNEPVDQHDDGEAIFDVIDAGKSIACPHCYAAHLAIQERKLARKQLGHVKGAMTKALQ